MPTTLESVVAKYLRSGNPAQRTREEYSTTLRKWARWGGGVPFDQLGSKEIREFLDWVYEPVRPMRSIRVEFLAKLRFFYLLDLPDAHHLIDAQIAICQDEMDRFIDRSPQDYPDGDPFYDLLSSFRQRQIALIIDWLNTCKQEMIPTP